MTYSEQLRLIADFFERHPDLPTPLLPSVAWAASKEATLAVAKIPTATKRYDAQYLWIDVPIGGDIKLSFFTDRKTVCTAKRVETIVEPAQPERTYEKVVEWECHPLLQESEGSDNGSF